MAFKSEGSAYVGAETVLPFKQCLAWYLQNNAALDEDDRALLKRWLHDDRASEAWSAIQAHSEETRRPDRCGRADLFYCFHPRSEECSRI